MIKFYRDYIHFTLQIIILLYKISLQVTALDYKESYLENHASYDLPFSIDFREYQLIPKKKIIQSIQTQQEQCPIYSNYLSLALMSDILYIRNQRVFSNNQTMTFQNGNQINIEPLQMIQNQWIASQEDISTYCKLKSNDDILQHFISDDQNLLLNVDELSNDFSIPQNNQSISRGTKLNTFVSFATAANGSQSTQKLISVFQKLNDQDKLSKENITQIKQVLISGLPIVTYMNNKQQNTCDSFDQLGLIIGYGKQDDIPVWVVYINGTIQYHKIGQNSYCEETKMYTIEPTDFFKQDSQGFINILYLQKWTYQYQKGKRNQDGYLQDDLLNVDLTKQKSYKTIKIIFGIATVLFTIGFMIDTGKK